MDIGPSSTQSLEEHVARQAVEDWGSELEDWVLRVGPFLFGGVEELRWNDDLAETGQSEGVT